jgi:glyoxylase-like metal-dependent hydrolase (beta-lactamase superfamily II)
MKAVTHMNGNAKVRLDPQESDTNDLLNWDVFVTPSIPTVWSDLPPGTKQLMWSPISSTLIYGKRDAVLASPQSLASFWNPFFPGQISNHLVIAEGLTENVMDLEGHDLVVVPLGHTDTDYTTCLHVPSVGLVVAGDAAYNGVHQWLAESSPQTRREWIAALDAIEALKPRAVIAGHKRPGNDDSPKIIEETRQYIRDFDRVAGTTTTARELYDKMLELYPDRVNPGALWLSARAVKP